MAIKINFDLSNNPEIPTFVLASKSGKRIGELNPKNIVLKGCENAPNEITFNIFKVVDGTECIYWDEIRNFRLIWCKEWDMWFQLTLEISESNDIKKSVYCTSLGEAELSQLMLYGIEINTENDIAREDYKMPTILYDEDHPEASLLHRILQKAPHYNITHVDPTIAKLQRTFSFDDISIYDALQEIAQEIGCIFLFPSNSDKTGRIQRSIEVYDLESNCEACWYRGDFTGKCPKCESASIHEGYGNDTTIFITSDELANDIQFTTDTDAVKNCFKLEGGDDLMTATIRSCNPNGSDYIWHITDELKRDMSPELVDTLNSYEQLYSYYQNEYVADINNDILDSYNSLVDKYRKYNEDLLYISPPITGYPSLMEAYFNTIDFELYLHSSLMPTYKMSDTSAQEQAGLLTNNTLSPVSVSSLNGLSVATSNNAVIGMAKAIIDARYSIKVKSSSLSGLTWTGVLSITNYSDENDTASTGTLTISINDNYQNYIQQKIEKSLAKGSSDNPDIGPLFKNGYSDFCNEIQKYCLDSLNAFADSCQACLDILIEQGIADKQTWASINPDLYTVMYVPYYQKLDALNQEIALRESEIDLITGKYDDDGTLLSSGIQTEIERVKNNIQNALDFQSYLGNELWLEFCAYRREDRYTNSNYISDGLNNAELFVNALEFINTAEKEIYKSAELQHSISTSLKNLLVMDKFKPLISNFEVGNWLRIKVDESIYKLRLLEYQIDYDNWENISVVFSDILNTVDGSTAVQSILAQAKSMSSSYDHVQKQASNGQQGKDAIDDMQNNGIDTSDTKIVGGGNNRDSEEENYQSQVWDSHGILLRKYDPITKRYDPTQLKLVNSSMMITNDNWRSVKTAVGNYYYYDPLTKELLSGYGINAETLVGKLIIGESLGIYSSNNSLIFNKDGLKITNGVNTFAVNPNAYNLLTLSNSKEDIFYVDRQGVLHIKGDGSGLDISGNAKIQSLEAADVTINNKLVVQGELIAQKATIEQLNGVSARLQTVESDYVTTTYLTTNYLTAKSVKTDYMEVANWTSAGKIRADRIDADTIAAKIGEFSGDLSVQRQNVQSLFVSASFWVGGVGPFSHKSIKFKDGDKNEINIQYLGI